SGSRGADVYVCGIGLNYLSSSFVAERAWWSSTRASRLEPERDLRSLVPAHVSVGSGDCRARVAVTSQVFGDWRVASDKHDALPARVFAWTQGLLRIVVLERAAVGTGTRSLVASLSIVQS